MACGASEGSKVERRMANIATNHDLSEVEKLILAVVHRFESFDFSSYEKAVEGYTKVIYTKRHGVAVAEDEENMVMN